MEFKQVYANRIGARRYAALEHSDPRSLRTLSRLIALLTTESKALALTDLGPGNGLKTVAVLKATQDILLVRLLDFSRPLLQIAEREVRRVRPSVKVVCKHVDFDRPEFSLAITSRIPQILLLLGNTVGNWSDRGMIGLLRRIGAGMTKADRLVVEVRRYQPQIIHRQLAIFRQVAHGAFFWPYIESCGYRKSEGKIALDYNPRTRRFDRRLELKNGNKRLLATSRVFTRRETVQLFHQAGFRVRVTPVGDSWIIIGRRA